uniref:Alpha/beta hydrolase fold-3 domain-containing protein n=1 Tax=Chrysotila carterae TaxID=13221 RepID=A0A6S9QG49_CHRCT
MLDWLFGFRVKVSWHDLGGGRRVCVAAPMETSSPSKRWRYSEANDARASPLANGGSSSNDLLPVSIWLAGGGLFRINPALLAYCVRAYASRGHLVVAPVYALSSPPVLYILRSVLAVALFTIIGSFYYPDSVPRIPVVPELVTAMLVGLCVGGLLLVPRFLCTHAPQHPDHVRDAARAVAWAVVHAPFHGGDVSKVTLAGHSAGGQLACMLLLQPQWLAEVGLDHSVLRGLLLLSPVVDWTWLSSVPAYVRHFSRELWIRSQFGTATPLAHVSPLHLTRSAKSVPNVPVLLVRAGREFGPMVNRWALQALDLPAMERALREAGVEWCSLERARGGHVAALFYLGEWWERSHPFWLQG